MDNNVGILYAGIGIEVTKKDGKVINKKVIYDEWVFAATVEVAEHIIKTEMGDEYNADTEIFIRPFCT